MADIRQMSGIQTVNRQLNRQDVLWKQSSRCRMQWQVESIGLAYARCKKSGIKPTRQGRRSFITNEDLECLASVCMESVCKTSGSDRQQIDNRQTADRQTTPQTSHLVVI